MFGFATKPDSATPPAITQELVAWLSQPAAWPDGPAQVECIETHISWVFLTRRYAFKLKKPVAFDFLDFRTLAARKTACEDEVRLNRRLARDVYLDIVPITAVRSGGFELAGHGAAVDYLVQMRRMSVADRFDTLLAAGDIYAHQIAAIAAHLAHFYNAAPPLTVRSDDFVQQLEHHVRENRRMLLATAEELPVDLIKRVCAVQLDLLTLHPSLIADRVRDGRIIEGHGDLRPEHIYLTPQPVILDCIEFAAEFRQLDIADELCFLAMECQTLGAPDVGRQLLQATLAELHDSPPEPLLAFYQSYRATVRAKVARLRAAQQSGEEAAASRRTALRYLQLADALPGQCVRPMLLVVGGMMGVGKSTLARCVAEQLGWDHLQTDAVRAELFPPENAAHDFGQGKYAAANRERVYATLLDRAAALLEGRLSVVVDGSFTDREQRRAFADLAARHGADCDIVWCHCPPGIARERIAHRLQIGGDASEARPELFSQQLANAVPPAADEAPLYLDTTDSLSEQLQNVYDQLADALTPAARGG